MCTAYELGKRGGTFPACVSAGAVRELLSISQSHLIRPTIPAPVVKADGSLATMRWGFRRAFAAKAKGRPEFYGINTLKDPSEKPYET